MLSQSTSHVYFIIQRSNATLEKPLIYVYPPTPYQRPKDALSNEPIFTISGTQYTMEFHAHNDHPAQVHFCGTTEQEARAQLQERLEAKRLFINNVFSYEPEIVGNFPEHRLQVWRNSKVEEAKEHAFYEWWDVVGFEFGNDQTGKLVARLRAVLPAGNSDAAVQMSKARLLVR